MIKKINTPVRYLKGIGPKRAAAFASKGVFTVEDLLYYFPYRYEDRSNLSKISKLQEGQVQAIKAQVIVGGERRSFRRRGFSITEIVVGDETGKINCVWFNQPYLRNYFKPGVNLILYGKVERYGVRLQMSSPEFEIISEETDSSLNTGRIVPVYSLLEGLSQRVLRKVIKQAIDEYLVSIQDFLPYDMRSKHNLLNLAKSLLNIHFPESFDMQKLAYDRLAFEEFFLFQVPLAMRKREKKEKKGIAHIVEGKLVNDFIASMPFKLTLSQEKVIEEIKSDMQRAVPMQRLLQGDVGSGKTVVAGIASIAAIQGGYQAAFMVPTEILARQHYANFLSYEGKIRIGLLTGSLTKQEKENICKRIKDGKIDLVVGTHALLEEDIVFKNLGLVVIDEQHKFGVGQRALLPKKGVSPDVLIMTATPIPRTLAITIYGDLDISVINELPPGRVPIKTMHFTPQNKKSGYEIAREELKKGMQAYIIYPTIEESFMLDIAGAKKMYDELRKTEFKDFKLGLIHGRLKQKEQDDIMQKFKDGKLDLLVSTTVLEVGIDIPKATCMIIESAERFGLSQLHQLRGRVGRDKFESFCILISEAQNDDAKARMEAMVKFSDGFRIAEEDLKIRGPGEFFGARQSGLSELKIGNPLIQMQLLKQAREEALKLVELDPSLNMHQNALLKEKLLHRFPEYEKLMAAG
ncbi:MAG: ATP-dependent DNA helicase RecG [Candidatus Omnitrophica bacterium]|nr:ATP-dependent DNA helicase RecG [Candidatus Omnitrophota bacterium]